MIHFRALKSTIMFNHLQIINSMNTTQIILLTVVIFLAAMTCWIAVTVAFKKRPFKGIIKKASATTVQQKDKSHYLDSLRNLATKCEERLIPEHQNLIKILIEKDYPELASILQLEEIKISIKRDGKNVSMFDVYNKIFALNLARCGHYKSVRDIPSKSELEFILAHREIINVYLENLGLETISGKDEYWFIDVPEGQVFSWKDYNWNLQTGFQQLKDKIKVLTPDGIRNEPSGGHAKLILLLNGWDHLFEEVNKDTLNNNFADTDEDCVVVRGVWG